MKAIAEVNPTIWFVSKFNAIINTSNLPIKFIITIIQTPDHGKRKQFHWMITVFRLIPRFSNHNCFGHGTTFMNLVWGLPLMICNKCTDEIFFLIFFVDDLWTNIFTCTKNGYHFWQIRFYSVYFDCLLLPQGTALMYGICKTMCPLFFSFCCCVILIPPANVLF